MARSEKFLCKRIRQKEHRRPIAANAPPFVSFHITPGFTNPLS